MSAIGARRVLAVAVTLEGVDARELQHFQDRLVLERVLLQPISRHVVQYDVDQWECQEQGKRNENALSTLPVHGCIGWLVGEAHDHVHEHEHQSVGEGEDDVAEHEYRIGNDVVDDEDDQRHVVIHYLQCHQRLRVPIEFPRELDLSQEDGPEEEGEQDLCHESHLEEYRVPFPRLEDTVLVFSVHEVLWWLFGRKKTECQGNPGTHQGPVGNVSRLPEEGLMEHD